MSRKRITTQDFERHIKSQMKQESVDRALHRDALQRANTRAFCDSDKRVDSLRRHNKNEIIRNQQNEIDRYNERKEIELNRKKEDIKSAAILNEITSRKQESERKESLKKRICANSEELKDLMKSLNAAYLNLNLEQQISSKQLQEVNDKNDALGLQKVIEELNKKQDLMTKQKEEEKKLKLLESTEIIEKQLREKELRKQNEYKEFLKEKEEIEKILKKVEMERNEKLQIEHQKREETKHFIENYLIEREEFALKQKQFEKQENKKIAEWDEIQQQRLRKIEERKKEKQERDRLKYEAVKNEIEEKQKENEFLDECLRTITEEENQLKILEKERRIYEKKLRLSDEMKEQNKKQIELKAMLMAKEKDDEMKLRKELLDKFEKDERLKLLSAQKQRLKMMQYKKDVQDIIEERRRLKEMEKENELIYDQKAQEFEKEKDDIVQRERLRLIQEHAPKLKHFLSTRIASNEDEFEIIRKYIM